MSAKKPRPPAANKTASGPRTPAGEPTAQASDPAQTSPHALPAFGFAHEVLAQRRLPETEGVDRPAGMPDPERVFAFADSLVTEEREPETAPQRMTTWVTFELANEVFAIPVEWVREALRVTTITRVPHAPHPIRGVTNLRGKVIPVIDLRLRLELTPKDLDRTSRILVVGSKGRFFGLLVDAVRQVVHLDLNRVQPPPEDVMTLQSDYIIGVYQQSDLLILLLDVDRILIIKEAGAA